MPPVATRPRAMGAEAPAAKRAAPRIGSASRPPARTRRTRRWAGTWVLAHDGGGERNSTIKLFGGTALEREPGQNSSPGSLLTTDSPHQHSSHDPEVFVRNAPNLVANCVGCLIAERKEGGKHASRDELKTSDGLGLSDKADACL